MVCTDIMQDRSEVIPYDRAGVPLYIRTSCLSGYQGMQAVCHWHEDVEFIRVLEGRMIYDINGRRILLEQGDLVWINARQMHYGCSFQGQECRFVCILVHPSLLTGSRIMVQKYITSVLEQPEYLHFAFGREEERKAAPGMREAVPGMREAAPGMQKAASELQRLGQELVVLIDRIAALKQEAQDGYELEAVGVLHIVWSRLWQCVRMAAPVPAEPYHSDLESQKDMVSYIYQHYAEKITLADIAAAGRVCRSKCCAVFKRYLQQSPVDFLNTYRLKVSCGQLSDTKESITEIAFVCGFNHPSYYSRLFAEAYGCTPSEYRRKAAESPGKGM